MAITKVKQIFEKTGLFLSPHNSQFMAGKIIGLGGVFIKSPNKENLMKWYDETLGIRMQDWGLVLPIEQIEKEEYQVFSVMSDTTQYMTEMQACMINWMVRDLEDFLQNLKSKGVDIVHRENSEFGNFAHILDVDGNKVELWEPPKSPTSV